MKKPAAHGAETQRLLVLRGLDMLDTLPEERFDRITRLARRVFGVPIALISLVDAERQWFKSRQGLDAPETSREISFCGHVVADDALMIVPDASDDDRFRDNPLVRSEPSIRFYAGCPVRMGGGLPMGTLCLIDRQPRALLPEDVALLRDLAAMVEDELRSLNDATTDPLTGLSNRRGFELLAGKSLAMTKRAAMPAALMLFDLDEFKAINDIHGHEIGDRALSDFAKALLKTFRDADVIARLGGDEFCVLACGPAEAMSAPLDRLESQLATLRDRPYQICFSVGTADYAPSRHASIHDLIADADQVMFTHKRKRRPSASP